MACPRCATETADRRWCPECERAFDSWSRRYASDIIWSLVAGGLIVSATAVTLPMIGLDWILAGTGVFGGFGAIFGLHRLSRRRRRRQFLLGAAIPRAYLPHGGSTS